MRLIIGLIKSPTLKLYITTLCMNIKQTKNHICFCVSVAIEFPELCLESVECTFSAAGLF